MKKVNLDEKFGLFDDLWAPRVVGELNGQLVKLAKVKGEFVWHKHDDEDELFLVLKGALTMRFRDRVVELGVGEFCIVPRGVEHRPEASEETHIMLFEPKQTAHTGALKTEMTVETQDWI